MALVGMKQLLLQAQAEHRGVGAFNMGSMEMIIGAVKASEETDTPVILQLAEKRMRHSPLRLMAPMLVEAARQARTEIAVHLDHGDSMEVIRGALAYGFTSVMRDSSHCPYEENVRRTREAVEAAAPSGAAVEAELGLVGGSEGGAVSEIRYTDPADAERFVRDTGIDCLAVAIGNAHGDYPAAPHLAFDVLTEIHRRCGDLPLVLHGGSGISDADFQRAISCGIVKLNIATATFKRLTARAEEYLKSDGPHNYFSLNEAMVQGAYENVRHHIEVFNCAKR